MLPSLPGYGFSGEPAELGWDSGRTARAWAELMHRLGYTRYVAQGGDVGALVTDLMGRQAVEGLVGYHLNLLTAVLAIGDHLPKESEQERAAAEAFATFRQDGFGYFLEMATRPQTIGYALLDSPVALAAWLLDHDTDSYYKISRAFVDGEPVGNLTRDNILDNITLYWLTGTAASAARSYWEDGRALAAALASGQAPPAVTVPVGFTTFPGEIWASPRSWVEAVYPGLAYFNEVDRGGHFAAWEEPELFADRGAGGVPVAALDERRVCDGRATCPRSAGRPSGSTPSHSAPPSCAATSSLVNFWTLTCINWLRTGAVRPRVVAGLPRRRAGRDRRPHAGVLVRARDRPRAAGDRRSGRSTTRSRSTTTTRSGAPSPTTTGRRSTSSTRTASSATSTSARDATSSPSASSSGCSASSASSSPSKGVGVEAEADWDHLRTPETYLGYERSERFASPDGAAFDERRAYELPERLRLNHWALAGEWTIGRENVVLDEAGGSIAFRFHARDAHLVLSPGAREPIPFRVLARRRGSGPVARRRRRRGRQRRAPRRPPVPARAPARRGPRADAGDHVPRARRRGVRVHVRLGCAG